MNDIEYSVGGMWEDSTWQICFNQEIYIDSDVKPCKHCGSIYIKTKKYGDNYFDEEYCICPSVVVGVNEGGHNSTGICLQCIIEATEAIKNNIQ